MLIFTIISATIEACGLNNAGGFSVGFVNIFSLNDHDSPIDVDCQQNIGSYDPNDKQAFPVGYREAHYIERGIDLDYLIRFQNTGTDTAFKVVIRDTLSPFLNPAAIVPGSSSHPYQFQLSDRGIITFTFDPIMLPDSNINEPASHGFVKFKIAQKENLPLGTVIENSAAIYFDFNAPVITNTTFHTIGKDFIEIISDIDDQKQEEIPIRIFPNPASASLTVMLEHETFQEGSVELFQFNGQLIRTHDFSGSQIQISLKNLPKGIYFLSVKENGISICTRKLIIQ